MTTLDSGLSTFWRYVRAYPEYVCGTGNDIFARKLGESFYGVEGGAKGLYFSKIKTQFKDAFTATIEANEKNIADNGGFWKNLKKSFTSIPDDFKALWKEGGEAAAAASKTGSNKFWMQLKNCSKGVTKRMPLLGTIMIVAGEIPNLFRATRDEGLLTGAGEAGKAAARLGISTLFGALGTALCPVCPLAGTFIGYAVGDFVGKLIMGKNYTEKQEAQKAQQVQTAVNNQPQSLTPGGAASQIMTNPQNAITIPPGMEYGTFLQNNISKENLAKLEQQYYQMANPGMNGFTPPNGFNAYA